MGQEARDKLLTILNKLQDATLGTSINTAVSTPNALPLDAPSFTKSGAFKPREISPEDITKIDTLVSTQNPLLDKKALKLALIKAAKYPGGIEGVYERIVGEK